MLDDKGVFLVKRQAGLQCIIECGLLSWQGPETQYNDMTEVVSNVVHDVMMRYLVATTGSVRIYGDAILDQEWLITRVLMCDLRTIARLYFDGKIKMENIIR